ncbi:transposase [Pediococcus acidilactici]
MSLKHIANELSTSDSFVGRQLLRAERDFKPKFHWFPYDFSNKLQVALKHKDWNNYNASFWNTEGCSEEILSTLKMLQTHHDEIHNTFSTQHSNGPLEGLNNKIKTIKRAGFGYRSFFKFRIRVLYVLCVYTKKALITK